ncbi:DUF397 domain-containing protein [Streptomyces virginiae]|uniref:DUF397 domain-containing protein n=1 Tax=Streptomyces virginiae TaxID=1961 RepID=UPI0030D2FC60
MSWFKSSHSEASGNACVEVAVCEGEGVAIRDSVYPDRAVRVSRAALAALVSGVAAGRLAHLAS